MEGSNKLEDSACNSCADGTNRHCGGDQAMSLYKLRGECTVLGPVFDSSSILGTSWVPVLHYDNCCNNLTNQINLTMSQVKFTPLYQSTTIVFTKINNNSSA